jgi:hypothetical protein
VKWIKVKENREKKKIKSSMKPTQATTMKMKYLNGQKESYTLAARKKSMKKRVMYVNFMSKWIMCMSIVLCFFLLLATSPKKNKINWEPKQKHVNKFFPDSEQKPWYDMLPRKTRFFFHFFSKTISTEPKWRIKII